MRYEDARDKIADGDILGVSCKGLFWSLVKVVQRAAGLGKFAQITHVGVAWWVNGRLYSVEMDGAHNVLRPVSQYIAEGSSVTVFRSPVTQDAMRAQYDRATSEPIQYDYLDLLRIGLRLLLRTSTGTDGNGEMVCSTFASRWLQWAGWTPPTGFPDMPSPGELCRALGHPTFAIEAASERP
jgi:hypothetical protein